MNIFRSLGISRRIYWTFFLFIFVFFFTPYLLGRSREYLNRIFRDNSFLSREKSQIYLEICWFFFIYCDHISYICQIKSILKQPKIADNCIGKKRRMFGTYIYVYIVVYYLCNLKSCVCERTDL